MEELSTPHLNEVDGEKVFGMSKAGGCSRSASLGLLGYEDEDVSGASKLTFFMGHSVECAALATLDITHGLLENQSDVILYGDIDGKQLPIFKSKSDGLIKILGKPTVVSVKSTAYKMSSRQKGKFLRRGFTELPFAGVLRTNPSAYIQLQLELAGSGVSQGLFLYVSKDIVKAFENDEYVGEKGNGSLAFYVELVKYDPAVVDKVLSVYQESYKNVKFNKEAGKPLYPTNQLEFVELEKAEYIPSNIWGGKNKERTGSFNPCGGCAKLKHCANI